MRASTVKKQDVFGLFWLFLSFKDRISWLHYTLRYYSFNTGLTLCQVDPPLCGQPLGIGNTLLSIREGKKSDYTVLSATTY